MRRDSSIPSLAAIFLAVVGPIPWIYVSATITRLLVGRLTPAIRATYFSMLHRGLGPAGGACPYLIAVSPDTRGVAGRHNGRLVRHIWPACRLPRNCRMSGALTANRTRRQQRNAHMPA